MITDDQYAGLCMTVKGLQKQVEEWKKKYYDVADAICRESHGVEDLCSQARELRKRAEHADKRAGERWDKLRAEELDHALTRRQLAQAADLLRRWEDWARAHGHDVGMLDDTRAFLPILPNGADQPPARG